MFSVIAKLVSQYPRFVLGAWLLLTLCAIPFASRVGEVLTAQPAAAEDSVTARVNRILNEDFGSYTQGTIILVARSEDARVGDEAFDGPYQRALADLRALPSVQDVQDRETMRGIDLTGPDNAFTIAIINLAEVARAEASAAAAEIESILETYPDLDTHIAGGAATVRELEAISARDAARAELFGLPLSLVVLLFAFGALVASGLPLLVALTAITLSFAALYGLGQFMEFAVFTQSIVTMLGLAIGINHALLIVNRFREELPNHPDARTAAAATAKSAGKAASFSTLTTITALAALLVPPLNFIRSVGIGTLLVLFVGMLVSLTALPALLALLGKRVDALKLTRRVPGQRSRMFWRRRAESVMRHPARWALGGLILIVALGVPTLGMQLADPGARGLSETTDAYQVESALREAGLVGLLNSYDVVVDFGERESGFFHPSSVRAMSRFSRDVEALDGIAQAYSPMSAGSLPRLMVFQYYATREVAEASELRPLVDSTISDNDRYALMRIFPSDTLSPGDARGLREALEQLATEHELSAIIGGSYVRQVEWTDALYRDFPLTVGLIYLVTFVLLGVAFRSLVIPIKAIILNTLTVAASFGIITLVFQHGLGSSLIGLPVILGFVDSNVPLFIFAILFGLSMDYEVFIVSRIQEGHERGLSDRDAVVSAMGTTGNVISSAATIMFVVFSLFIFSEVALIKTLGLGLSVAVLIDAALVHLTLVPAVMLMAGRWNWWLPQPVSRLIGRIKRQPTTTTPAARRRGGNYSDAEG